MEFEPIESAIQLSSLKTHSSDKKIQSCSQKLISYFSSTCQGQRNLSNLSISADNSRCLLSKTHKKTPYIVGKRGTRDTEFTYPSSLAYSKRDKLICKLEIKEVLFSF